MDLAASRGRRCAHLVKVGRIVKKNARQTLARPNRHQHRRFNCFDDFVGAMRLPGKCYRPSPRADDNEIVLPAQCFTENLRSRLAGLDDGPKLDASLPQDAGLAIKSLTQRLVVGWVFDDAEEVTGALVARASIPPRCAAPSEAGVPSLQIRMFIVCDRKTLCK